ncbi:MAG: hypothetical protein ACE5FD_15560, partial [Anaerolineae bacterium]
MKNLPRQQGVEPYWYIIGGLLLAALILFLNHLRTGETPSRVFLHISALDFDIFWYGICIVGGIALGSFVVARLVEQRGTAVLYEHVPRSIRQKPVSSLTLPDEIRQILVKRKINTLGDLLLRWG